MVSMKKVYFAAPLFTQAEKEFNRSFCEKIRDLGYEVFLPQEHIGDAIFRLKNWGEVIFENDLKALKACDIVVAIIDGADADSGTSWEMGYATALGKRIIALRTDIRKLSENEMVNLMLECKSETYQTIEDVLKHL